MASSHTGHCWLPGPCSVCPWQGSGDWGQSPAVCAQCRQRSCAGAPGLAPGTPELVSAACAAGQHWEDPGRWIGLLFFLTEEAKEFPHEVFPLLFGIKRRVPPSEPLSPLSTEACGQQGPF